MKDHRSGLGPRDALSTVDEGRAFFNEEVGNAIRHHRHRRGITQARLAMTADLSPNYVARLERGELGPSLHVAVRLAAALEIDPTELVASFRGRCARLESVA